ncbi:MAG: amidohydrolase, partial [Pseudomonadales bacterium]
GTRANRETLDLYQRVWQKDETDGKALRWRVEHAQHIHPEDVPRFGKLGVIAAMQGIHCASDGPWIAARLGEGRTGSTSYPWRSLIEGGAVLGNGSDVPVEPIDPIASFTASVTRITAAGEAFYPQHKLTRAEALASYTINNAYAAFEETLKGSLTPGKLADLVVLSDDIMTVPDEQIGNAVVDLTVVGGEIKYAR